jgi:MinD-like ATPase involved in chromosome partitioning or flagellar assembly
MGTVISIVSGKGGVGKTTLCANLAFALAMAGHSVIALDGDMGLRNLGGAPRYEHASTEQVMNQLSMLDAFDKII